ncbi:MAG TPA: hypothetical protein VHZ55_20970 [Bryobacteraceae bacterium]|nr:hypothetical protein [Bryobacteraceae bacterium]
MPFECEREEADIEFLSDGIPENIIHTLSRIRALRVIPRTSAFRYKGRGLDPVKAGRELGVRLVLVGRVRERAGHVEITTELIDCIEEAQLWGEKYAR